MILSGRPIDAHQELNCATFHLSGELLATAGGDQFVKVWDTSNYGGVPVYKKSMREATSSMLSVYFSPFANLLCSTSNDKNSYLWDPIGRELKHTLSGHTEKVTCASFLPDSMLASCSWDRHVKLFDLNTGFCTGSFPLGSRMNSLCATPFNCTVCTAHVDRTIRVFDYRNAMTMHTITDAHSAAVTGVLMCPDTPNVLTSSKDNTLKLIDLRTLAVLKTYKNSEYKNQRDINLFCFSPNGKFIVVGGDEGKILFWNTQNAKLENLITCSQKSNKPVTCVTWNPKRNQLIACHDNSLYLYDGEVVH
jgi:autophagy-related protein 16